MPDMSYYENEKFNENDPDCLNKMYENISKDTNYMLYMIKMFKKEVSSLMAEISYLNDDISVDKKSIEHYNSCKKQYIELYNKFDDIRNYYDGSREP